MLDIIGVSGGLNIEKYQKVQKTFLLVFATEKLNLTRLFSNRVRVMAVLVVMGYF